MPATGDDPKDLRVGRVSKADAAAAPEAADGVSEATAAQAAAAVEGPGAADGLAEIAQAISAGTMDAAAAKAQLIDQAVAAQVPPGASAEMIADIRAEVAALLEADPILEQLLRG